MGCAPSKSNSPDVKEEKRPASPKEKKGHLKSPQKSKDKQDKPNGKEKLNNNAPKATSNDIKSSDDNKGVSEDVIRSIEAEIIQPVMVENTSAAPPSAKSSKQPDSPKDGHDIIIESRRQFFSGSPNGEVVQKTETIVTQASAPMTNGLDGESPPKPQRTFKHVNWTNDDTVLYENRFDRNKPGYSTFPRSRKTRPVSARERFIDVLPSGVSLERKTSLREKTPTRRKDLDYRSSDVYLGRTLSPPGRGKMIEKVDFFSNVEEDQSRDDEDDEHNISRDYVKSMASAYADLLRQREEAARPKSPVRRSVNRTSEEAETSIENDPDMEKYLATDTEPAEEGITERMLFPPRPKKEESGDGEGDLSAIEVMNQQLFPDYTPKKKKVPTATLR